MKIQTVGDNNVVMVAQIRLPHYWYYKYTIQHDLYPIGEPVESNLLLELDFQHGLRIEDLLEVCKHRLNFVQNGKYSCRENEKALTHIEEALMWLNKKEKLMVYKDMPVQDESENIDDIHKFDNTR